MIQGIDACQCCQHPTDNEPAQLLRLREKALYQRMDAILGAKVIVLIYAAAVIGIVIEQIIRAVSDEKTQCDDQERNPEKISVAPSQDTCNHTGIHSNQCDG